MKTFPHHQLKLKPKPNVGIALILVLAFLVLITGLVLAFFASVTTELTGAKSYASGVTSKQLADSAVQVVMGSIKAATSQGTDIAWASQPGMIRTYGNTGSPLAYYKLYSSDNLIVQAPPLNFDAGADVDAAWDSKTALFTDLNSPTTDSGGNLNFPVIDPRAYDGTNNSANPSTTAIRGFSYAGSGVNGLVGPPALGGSPDAQRLPMPAKWLYVLRDGTLTGPDPTGTTIALFTKTPPDKQPTATNPIVGRIAYWTDDETAKVNINTAGEGTYWDTPHFYQPSVQPNYLDSPLFDDYGFAAFQPAQFEFQRYPGHPAQVALSPIFAGLRPTLPGIPRKDSGKEVAPIIPRLVWGGSEGGTKTTSADSTTGATPPPIDRSKAPRTALYTSVDELLFSEPVASSIRKQNVITNGVAPINTLTTTLLERARFFITANSRAPEVNLFNKPRVVIWPIHKDLVSNSNSAYTTAYDRLIAFCSTLRKDLGTGAYRFHIQRENSQSPTNDYDNIPDNKNLYTYLQGLMSKLVPGFGGSFANKFGADSDQVLIEIFDYIRCTNLTDPYLGGIPKSPAAGGAPFLKTKYQSSQLKNEYNSEILCGQVMPLRIGSTMGFGRYHTIKDVSMDFICTGDGAVAASNVPATNPTLDGKPLAAASEKRFQLGLFLNYFLPSQGQLKCGPDQLIRINGLDSIEIQGATNIGGGGKLFEKPPTASGWTAKLSAHGYSGYNPVPEVLNLRYPCFFQRSPFYSRPPTPSNTVGSRPEERKDLR